jgi:hypothetical protein
MSRSLSLCANTHHVPNCNDVCMHCCQTQYLKEIFLRVSFLWNLPHFVVTFHGPLSLPLDLSFEYKFGYSLSMKQNCFLLSMQSLPVILI